MNIKDCIREIIPALSARIEGQVVYPVRLNYDDGVGYKFACPYCCEMQKRPATPINLNVVNALSNQLVFIGSYRNSFRTFTRNTRGKKTSPSK